MLGVGTAGAARNPDEWSADRARRFAEDEVRCFDELDKKYHELLYAVETKYPDETRHETALRYIRKAESKQRLANNIESLLKQTRTPQA